ncbi:hypothetical protein RFI_01135 [Reticulomyxa filosa]|uniref:RRM domain-containing protein n=1 Tax=Reticulomyxa filosa TaxID=46433 RepID=X6PD02_RETFI|nr:hypothetical protein RFI_01135 [Reticulomyxa filosa]|eukprot:ETO35929.1 hypothetical protein RFI_01135 [Reticulomyxa filosa]
MNTVSVSQINKYSSWPPVESEQYTMYHPMGWPVDPEYPYHLNNFLIPNTTPKIVPPSPLSTMTGTTPSSIPNPLSVAAAVASTTPNPLINPALAKICFDLGMMNPLVNPFINPAMNPLLNPLTNVPSGIPDGKQHALFVFHLPEDIDDHGLLQLFAPYGGIRANVMRHDTGRSRGFGFVHFNNRNDALIAIEMMNGHQIGRKRLRVSFKKDIGEGFNLNGEESPQDTKEDDNSNKEREPKIDSSM